MDKHKKISDDILRRLGIHKNSPSVEMVAIPLEDLNDQDKCFLSCYSELLQHHVNDHDDPTEALFCLTGKTASMYAFLESKGISSGEIKAFFKETDERFAILAHKVLGGVSEAMSRMKE